jgi:hypothetical protein
MKMAAPQNPVPEGMKSSRAEEEKHHWRTRRENMINEVSAAIPLAPAQQGGLRRDYQELKKALDTGDVTAARSALAQFAKDVHGIAGAEGRNLPPKIAQDLHAMQQALASGDVASAEQVFAKFTQDGEHLARVAHHRPQVPPAPIAAPTPSPTSVDVTA